MWRIGSSAAIAAAISMPPRPAVIPPFRLAPRCVQPLLNPFSGSHHLIVARSPCMMAIATCDSATSSKSSLRSGGTFGGGAAPVAAGVDLDDRGVVHEAVDGRDGHGDKFI
jgi:hypothetical protein